MKKILLLCMAVLLCACAKQPALQPGPETQTQLESRWLKFTALSAAAPVGPYRLQLSMRFGSKGDTRRVTALFWGNNERQLRLDVTAGVGAVVAKILEDGRHFLVYSPRENKGYFYQGASQPLLQVGVPVPFNLGHLADLLNGRYTAVFGENFDAASGLKDGLARYRLVGNPGGSLDLNSEGLPVFWRESSAGGRGWTMEITYDEDSRPPLPRRLTLIHSNGKRAILLVKEREKPVAAFTVEQMSLTLPESAPLLPLAQYKNQ